MLNTLLKIDSELIASDYVCTKILVSLKMAEHQCQNILNAEIQVEIVTQYKP